MQHGRLRAGSEAPELGESIRQLLSETRADGIVIEQILSGELIRPEEYLQGHDEWVLVLGGGATIEIDGEALELSPHDWVLLPAGVPHRVLRTEPGTSWLAVHLGAGGAGSSAAP